MPTLPESYQEQAQVNIKKFSGFIRWVDECSETPNWDDSVSDASVSELEKKFYQEELRARVCSSLCGSRSIL